MVIDGASLVKSKASKWSLSLGCLVLGAFVLVGCSSPADRPVGLSDFQSPDPTVRVLTIKWAGDNKVPEAVPLLVDCLQDEDRAIRFYAIQSLRRITGTDLGYDYKASATDRLAAVKRWREFVEVSQSSNDE